MTKYLLRQVKHSDKSISRYLCINHSGAIHEVKIQAKQYNALKKIGCFEIAETDYSKQTSSLITTK